MRFQPSYCVKLATTGLRNMDIMSQELQTKEADHPQLGFLARSCPAKADMDKQISDTNGLLSSAVP